MYRVTLPDPATLPGLDALLAPGALTPTCRLVLDYWLSLRKGGALPSRTDFNPAEVKSALPNLVLFDVKLGESIVCRLVGSAITAALGVELSGKDFREFTPVADQEMRMNTHARVLSGLALVNKRSAVLNTGRVMEVEELVLPFGDMREDGTRQLLNVDSTDWLGYGERVLTLKVLGAPESFQYYRLDRPAIS